ncbi:MAG: Stp1/IreP family PP2C-type Ser/Thr phosphatase [Burkholderiales bacterium]
MKPAHTLEFATATDPGMVRSHNEDSFEIDPELGLAVLADGMGGYNAGEVASGIAVAMIKEEMRNVLASGKGAGGPELAEALITENSAKANGAIYQTARSQPQYAGMGTTLVVALFHGSQITVGHIGDSRLYRYRAGQLEQVTRDHSLLQEQIDSGMISKEQARYSQNKNLVTRAVGIDPEVETEVHTHDALPGDIYLLCSDGLSDMVADEDIQSLVEQLQSNLALAASQLVQLANDSGGRDNITVVLVRVGEASQAEATGGWMSKLKAWFK